MYGEYFEGFICVRMFCFDFPKTHDKGGSTDAFHGTGSTYFAFFWGFSFESSLLWRMQPYYQSQIL